jgi:hypothetical protein
MQAMTSRACRFGRYSFRSRYVPHVCGKITQVSRYLSKAGVAGATVMESALAGSAWRPILARVRLDIGTEVTPLDRLLRAGDHRRANSSLASRRSGNPCPSPNHSRSVSRA